MRDPAPLTTAEADAGVVINLVNGSGALHLRSWTTERVQGDRIVRVGGRELPRSVGGVQYGDIRTLCLGPAEWMVVAYARAIARFHEQFGPQLRAQGIVATDLTCAQAQLRVHGRAVRDLLSKGCGLDLHPRSFPQESCARTRFAQIPVVLECTDTPTQFVLHFSRRYLAYLQSWLADAALEFTEHSG